MSQKFNLNRDINGIPSYAPNPATDCQRFLAAQNVVVTFTVPANFSFWTVNISTTPGTNVFVSFDGSVPTVPNGGGDTNAQPLLPRARTVKAGTVIKAICPDPSGSWITMEYWPIDVQTNVM